MRFPQVHHLNERIKCEEVGCNKVFAHRKSLKKHMETHMEGYQPPAKVSAPPGVYNARPNERLVFKTKSFMH